MLKPCTVLPIAVISVLTACQTEQGTPSSWQDTATKTALDRGKSDLNCPTATAQPLTQHTINPQAVSGKMFTEYTVGVSGCSQQVSYIVACEANSSKCYRVEPATMRTVNQG
jgi:hypothetical protein